MTYTAAPRTQKELSETAFALKYGVTPEQADQVRGGLDPLLTSKEVCAVLGRSHASLYRDIHAGTIPPPVKIGSSSRWPASEVRALIEKAKAARDGEAA